MASAEDCDKTHAALFPNLIIQWIEVERPVNSRPLIIGCEVTAI